MKTSPRSASIIASAEMLLLFIAGILGNKIGESLNIPNNVVYATTIICLVILASISYIRTHDVKAIPIKPIKFNIPFSRFIPKTMVGIFPFGVIAGFALGAILPAIASSEFVATSGWIVTLTKVGMHLYESAGISIGVIICLLFAIAIDGPLASALAVGYGISFAAAILLIRPNENIVMGTYSAYIIGFGLLALILILAEPIFTRFRTIVTEPRV